MGGLSMNPDNHGVESGPKLSMQIAKEEEYLGLNRSTAERNNVVNVVEEDGLQDGGEKEKTEKPSKVKFLGFQLDTAYPRTVPGFVRIVQVLMLIVSFVCLLMGAWPDKGTYTFYCIFLVFGALISAYLLFTVIAGTREKVIFGITWRTVELVFFGLFGLLIFIGACLAANKSNGHPALNAAAAFGFLAVITFGYYFYVTWKSKPNEDEDSDEQKPPENIEQSDGQEERPPSGANNAKIELMDETQARRSKLSRRNSNSSFGHNSLPVDLSDGLYQNGKVFAEDTHIGRPLSPSDHDSAYSEGESTPTRGKMAPQRMRRTGSGYNLGRRHLRDDFDQVSQRQPLSHMSHRPYQSGRGGSWKDRSLPGVTKSYGYPEDRMKRSFTNPAFEVDDLHRSSGRRKSMPEWLRTALGEDVGQDSMVDDESVRDHPVKDQVPPKKHPEYPLLNASDEESVCYPSAFQNHMLPGAEGRMLSQTLPGNGGRREAGNTFRHHPHHHHRHHTGRGRRHGGRRRHHHHHHHAGRKGLHHGHRGRKHHGSGHGNTFGGGRRAFNSMHDRYLQKMAEREQQESAMHGFQPFASRPIETGRRRMIPEQPVSIHFPERSRWDDDGPENLIMAKYFADAQNMRG